MKVFKSPSTLVAVGSPDHSLYYPMAALYGRLTAGHRKRRYFGSARVFREGMIFFGNFAA